MIPFECDLCIFRKLCRHDPLLNSERDKLLLAYIQRISLDAFWSRASSTVSANRNKMKQALALSELVGLSGLYERYGTMPAGDTFGYQVTIQTVTSTGKACEGPYTI
jgi:hypothetical protein